MADFTLLRALVASSIAPLWFSYTFLKIIDLFEKNLNYLKHFITVSATTNWWGLHTDELALLSAFVWSEFSSSFSDTPVFLPIKVG